MEKNIIRIATWNTRSWNNKTQEILIELTYKNIDICAISEKKKKGQGIIPYQDYIMFFSGVPWETRAREGVGLVLHKKYKKSIDEFNFISERILMVSLKMKLDTLYVFSVYAPEDCKSKMEKDTFYETLREYLDRIPASNFVLILGDLTARIGNDTVNGVKQRFNEDVMNENGTVFTQFCADNELRINNTFFQNKVQYKITWQNTRGQHSTTNYIVSNRKIHPSQILDVRSLNSADIGSDHSLVLCKIRLLIQKNRKKGS